MVTLRLVWQGQISLRETKPRTSMFYVYVLKSNKNKDIYVGYTADLKTRFKLHNSGKVKSTKPNKPWRLACYEAYRNKFDATKRERQLKMHAAKSELLKKLENSLKE